MARDTYAFAMGRGECSLARYAYILGFGDAFILGIGFMVFFGIGFIVFELCIFEPDIIEAAGTGFVP